MGSTGGIDLKNVQGDILLDGLPKMAETFLFFTIQDAKAFCQHLKQVASQEIASAQQTKDIRSGIKSAKGSVVPSAGANIAFSFAGLQKMSSALQNLDLNVQDQAFQSGMKKQAEGLNDPMKHGSSTEPAYDAPFLTPQNIHGVMIAAGSDDTQCSQKLRKIQSIFGSAMSEVTRVSGKVRPGAMKGHEHFGYLDGVSQPGIRGIDPSVPPGQDTIPPGIILCNRSGDSNSRPQWMTDGSFLCFRKLQQNVPEWNQFLVDASSQLGTWSDQLGARLVGRWKSGCPIVLSPEFDDTGIAKDPNQVNKFEFDAAGDQFRCPLGAHIRKTNPRGDLGRGTVNQFRILRRGIPYGEEVDADPKGTRGLLFVCYQSDISRGFQFIQQTWANSPGFFGSGAGVDAIFGQSNSQQSVDMQGLFPQDPTRPLALSGVNRFVVPKGGEYFFSPSMGALTGVLTAVK